MFREAAFDWSVAGARVLCFVCETRGHTDVTGRRLADSALTADSYCTGCFFTDYSANSGSDCSIQGNYGPKYSDPFVKVVLYT